MRVQTALITIEGSELKEIRKPHSIKVETNFKELVSKAEFVIPRNVTYFDNKNPRDVFKHGSPVNISFGYNGNLIPRFSGYIVEVSADFPITIKLHDEMWKLKRIPVNFSAKGITLSGLLKTICKGYRVDALENVNLGTVKFSKTNVGEVLDKIRSDFGLYSYMVGKKLVCGKYYADNDNSEPVTINLDTFVASNSLEYTNAQDIIALVKGNTTIANKKVQYQTGEEGGDVYDFTYPLASSLDVLKIKVNQDYAKIRRGGYRGSLTIFGEPLVQHGERVKLVSNIYPDRTGAYYVDAVTAEYKQDGITQELNFGGVAA